MNEWMNELMSNQQIIEVCELESFDWFLYMQKRQNNRSELFYKSYLFYI
jgi:hypothetical protein